MELEELERRWRLLDQKIDRVTERHLELIRSINLRPLRQRTGRLWFWPALDIAWCSLVLLLTGDFLWQHRDTTTLFLPAVVLMLGCIMLINSGVRQLLIISQVDWSLPVSEIQNALSRLQMAKIKQFKWVILTSPLVGFCGLLVGLQFIGDRLENPKVILEKMNTAWVLANVIFGIVFVPVGHFAVSRIADRFQSKGWWKRVVDDLAGRSLAGIQRELEKWGQPELRST